MITQGYLVVLNIVGLVLCVAGPTLYTASSKNLHGGMDRTSPCFEILAEKKATKCQVAATAQLEIMRGFGSRGRTSPPSNKARLSVETIYIYTVG